MAPHTHRSPQDESHDTERMGPLTHCILWPKTHELPNDRREVARLEIQHSAIGHGLRGWFR